VCACLDGGEGPSTRRTTGSLRIAEENLRPGSPDWDAQLYAGVDSTIAAFGLPLSLGIGDTLHIFVDAKLPPVSVSIYRLGWYSGLGARRIARHQPVAAPRQPACSAPSPGPSVCAWSETDSFVVNSTWPPGLYLAKVADSLGQAGAFPFVVRSSLPAQFAVVLPFTTYQAYDHWGGTSLYSGPGATPGQASAARAVKVSFARPLDVVTLRGHFLGTDYPLVRWLEQHAYDVSYMTDYDFHLGREPNPAVAWLFSGHSEYWSWPMWVRANSARAHGINLAFLGGNDVYWVVRYEALSVNGVYVPVVVCYRDASLDPLGATPGLATVQFRSPPNNSPENALVGVMTPPGALVQHWPVDLVVATDSDPFMEGTGLTTGMHLSKVAGWEGDRLVDNGATPHGIRILFASPFIPVGDTAASGLLQATVYRWTPSGAIVFAAGEPGFAWGLTTYRQLVARPELDRFLDNVLQGFAKARVGQAP
jgi:hypothetical protein